MAAKLRSTTAEPRPGVGLLDRALDPGDRLVSGEYADELEETRLHHRVDPAAHLAPRLPLGRRR